MKLADEYAEKRKKKEKIEGEEQIPYEMVREMILEGNISLLVLWIGTANWGVSGVPEGLKDPAGLNWKGPAKGKGKRPRDYEVGGLGIAHFDKSRLADAYQKFGYPDGLTREELFEKKDGKEGAIAFDKLRSFENESKRKRWHKWQEWAKNLVKRDDFIEWTMNRWEEKYWNPVVQSNDTMEQAIVNSRIRNSASGIADSVAGNSVEFQIKAYEAYAVRRAGKNASDEKKKEKITRYQNQIRQARRVMALIKYVVESEASVEQK